MPFRWDPKYAAESQKVTAAIRALEPVERVPELAAATAFRGLFPKWVSEGTADLFFGAAHADEFQAARAKLRPTSASPETLRTPDSVRHALPTLILDDLLSMHADAALGRSATKRAAEAIANMVYYFAVDRAASATGAQKFVGIPPIRDADFQWAFKKVIDKIPPLDHMAPSVRRQAHGFFDDVDGKSVIVGVVATSAMVGLVALTARSTRA